MLKLQLPTNLQIRGALANAAPIAASLMVIAGTWLLYAGRRWTPATEEIRATGIVTLTVICAVLMGLGMFYLWQLLVKSVSVTGPGGFQAAINVAEDTDQSPRSTSVAEDINKLEPGCSRRPPHNRGRYYQHLEDDASASDGLDTQ